MIRKDAVYLVLFTLAIALVGCEGEKPVPKPVGYFRIDLPEREYTTKNPDCPFTIDISKHSYLEYFDDAPCWFNIVYPELNAKLHLTYKPVSQSNIREYIEESRNFAYEHQVKAMSIESERIVNRDKKVYGLIYDLGGNVASPYQFYITDSTHHFLRGSLYFRARPNSDSISPSLNYIKEDIRHMLNNFSWVDQ